MLVVIVAIFDYEAIDASAGVYFDFVGNNSFPVDVVLRDMSRNFDLCGDDETSVALLFYSNIIDLDADLVDKACPFGAVCHGLSHFLGGCCNTVRAFLGRGLHGKSL